MTPARLETEAGRKELFELATTYYRVTHDAIRRYDKNHLILGDRYEAGRPIADEVIQAAKPYVDVLSFQHFSTPEKVAENLDHWHQKTGKPVLLADHAVSVKQPDGSLRHDGAGYAETLAAVARCARLRRLPSLRRLPAQRMPTACPARCVGEAGRRGIPGDHPGESGSGPVDARLGAIVVLPVPAVNLLFRRVTAGIDQGYQVEKRWAECAEAIVVVVRPS